MTGHSALILARLQTGRGITQAEAYEDFGCTRLGARIWDLKQAGIAIVAEIESGYNREGKKVYWKRYRMGAS